MNTVFYNGAMYARLSKFVYIDKNTLLIGSHKGMADIRINRLEKFERVPLKSSQKQITFFLGWGRSKCADEC